MTAMYTRSIMAPSQTFFLFGPRATGKTTWLKSCFETTKTYWINLLDQKEYLTFLKNPSHLRERILPIYKEDKGTWFVIDEIQKLPILLDEVHLLINENPKIKFILTGSSARKLKRSGVNLLAGRAINRNLFSLTIFEITKQHDVKLEKILTFGLLPATQNYQHQNEKIDYLEAYVTNYLKEEIKEEALVKHLDGFTRFLEVAAIFNGQVVNVSNIASEAGVARTTVIGHFDILEDTLIGIRLPAWRPKLKVKEVAHPKFYFFDPGVVNAIVGRLRDPIDRRDQGFLFETIILNELRAYISYTGCGGNLFYWRINEEREIDFIWQRGKKRVAFEVKMSEKWKTNFGNTLKEFCESKKIDQAFGIYLGEHELTDGPITVLPLRKFVAKLWSAKILK